MSVIDDILADHTLVNQIEDEFDRVFGSLASEQNHYKEHPHILCSGDQLYIKERASLDMVKWKNGFITFQEVTGDAISFEYQGCLMARFCLDGVYYVAHIHCDMSQGIDRRFEWKDFITKNINNISELIMFKPGHHLINNPDLKSNVWGVITRDGTCYSIETFYSGRKTILKSISKHLSYGIRYEDYSVLWEADFQGSFASAVASWNRFWDRLSTEVVYPSHRCILI